MSCVDGEKRDRYKKLYVCTLICCTVSEDMFEVIVWVFDLRRIQSSLGEPHEQVEQPYVYTAH